MQSALNALISGYTRFQVFCSLIRVVENFHPRHLYSNRSFYLNFKIFWKHTSYYRGFCQEDHFGLICHHFWPFLTTQFCCFEEKHLPILLIPPTPIIFLEEILDPSWLFQKWDEMLFAIWHHFYNFQNVKNTHRGVLIY